MRQAIELASASRIRSTVSELEIPDWSSRGLPGTSVHCGKHADSGPFGTCHSMKIESVQGCRERLSSVGSPPKDTTATTRPWQTIFETFAFPADRLRTSLQDAATGKTRPKVRPDAWLDPRGRSGDRKQSSSPERRTIWRLDVLRNPHARTSMLKVQEILDGKRFLAQPVARGSGQAQPNLPRG